VTDFLRQPNAQRPVIVPDSGGPNGSHQRWDFQWLPSNLRLVRSVREAHFLFFFNNLSLEINACFRVKGVGGEIIRRGSKPHQPQKLQAYMMQSFSQSVIGTTARTLE
jgi:hypothetical protein